MNEIYKTIEEYDNYSISNYGNIMNKHGKILKTELSDDGYYTVRIQISGKPKRFLLHRLIAKAFIPNPENKSYVDHIDRNRTNNNLDNLRWATVQENNQNKNKQQRNKSGYLGVSFDNINNMWRSYLSLNGKFYGKRFTTIEEAIVYRAELERIHYGLDREKNITNNIQTVNTLNINQQETK